MPIRSLDVTARRDVDRHARRDDRSRRASIQGGVLPGPLPLFPRDNWWNANISLAPVDPTSASLISFIGSARQDASRLRRRCDAGRCADYGFPYAVVDGRY